MLFTARAKEGSKVTTNQNNKSANKITIDIGYYKKENQEALKRVIDDYKERKLLIRIKQFITHNDEGSFIVASAAQDKLPALF